MYIHLWFIVIIIGWWWWWWVISLFIQWWWLLFFWLIWYQWFMLLFRQNKNRESYGSSRSKVKGFFFLFEWNEKTYVMGILMTNEPEIFSDFFFASFIMIWNEIKFFLKKTSPNLWFSQLVVDDDDFKLFSFHFIVHNVLCVCLILIEMWTFWFFMCLDIFHWVKSINMK